MKITKVMSVILSLCLLLTVFVACDTSTTDSNQGQQSSKDTSTTDSNQGQQSSKYTSTTDSNQGQQSSKCTHSWESASCEKAKTCSLCSVTEGSALGHTWIDATCEKAKTCSLCSATEGSALGHTIVIDKAVAATCTQEGKTEGSHCSVCNTVIKAQSSVQPSHNAPHGICLECDQVIDSDEAINYYINIKTNAYSYYFSTYYNGSVDVKYSLNNAYMDLSFINGYDGTLYLTGTVDFVTSLEQTGTYFSGTGFLNYSIEENGCEIDDGTCTISGYGGGLASIHFFIRIDTITQHEYTIYFDNYYM